MRKQRRPKAETRMLLRTTEHPLLDMPVQTHRLCYATVISLAVKNRLKMMKDARGEFVDRLQRHLNETTTLSARKT
jgi:hypothetical protein